MRGTIKHLKYVVKINTHIISSYGFFYKRPCKMHQIIACLFLGERILFNLSLLNADQVYRCNKGRGCHFGKASDIDGVQGLKEERMERMILTFIIPVTLFFVLCFTLFKVKMFIKNYIYPLHPLHPLLYNNFTITPSN